MEGEAEGGGGGAKRGMSDCPFVDPRVNNSNLVKISHLPGLRKIIGFEEIQFFLKMHIKPLQNLERQLLMRRSV